MASAAASVASSAAAVPANGVDAPGKDKTENGGKRQRKQGVDVMLTTFGKSLGVGQEVRFTLVKGPKNKPQADPVNPKAPHETFPLVAKFPESVVQPRFQNHPWNTARLYQQDAPKAEEDSDEEDSAAIAAAAAKKRWKSRRQDPPKRQWILQEQVDFLETMMNKRQKKVSVNPEANSSANGVKNDISTRYQGVSEFNTSQYVLLEGPVHDNGSERPSIQVTMLPTLNATVQFSQPASRATLSMSQAEQAIEEQRGKSATRFFMQQQQRLGETSAAPVPSNAATARVPTTNIAKLTAGGGSRSRLFGKMTNMEKLQAARSGIAAENAEAGNAKSTGANNNDDDDDDDVMGDIAFRNRKSGNKKARKELLDTLGDSALKVDPDGVLGGANDSEFARGTRFGRFQTSAEVAAQEGKSDKDDANGTDAGPSVKANDGLAMSDDFYKRDVQAEYEELDYDANEQFDDDDVDLGESEVVVGDDGFGAEDDDDDNDLEEDETDENAMIGGAEGLASLAGFKVMLAKARGEITPEQIAEAQQLYAEKEKQRAERERERYGGRKRNRENTPEQLLQIMEAAQAKKRADENEKARRQQQNQQQNQQQTQSSSSSQQANDAQSSETADATSSSTAAAKTKRAAAASDTGGVQVDENGQRIINLSSVRREIWINNGRIPMRRLMKIFDVKKKSPPKRQSLFREVVKELCTMESDPINGRMLVLKQHYSNM